LRSICVQDHRALEARAPLAIACAMSEATAHAKSESAEGTFVRGLGLLDATNIVAGAMIGSGIFVVAQDIAQTVGSPGWMLMVWLVTGVMTVMVSLSYGELAAMYPQAGGQYVYLREAYSPIWGFLYGWTLFMVIQSGSIAAVGVVFAKYLGVLVPAISTSNWVWKAGEVAIGGKTIPIGVNTAQLVGIVVIALLTANNCIHLNAGKWVQNVFTTAKVIALAALIVVGLVMGQSDSAIRAPGFFTRHVGDVWGTLPMFAAFWTAMVGSMFASDAWNNVTFVAGEVRNPRRNIPLSLIFGAGGVVLLYLLVNVGYVNLLPFEAIANAPEQRVAAAAVGRLVPWGAIAISIVVMISTFGCLNGMILSGPRLYWAMAKDGLFFRAAGHLGRKSGVPVKGLVLQGVWSSLLALSGTYGDLLDYVIFAAMLFYVLTVIGIFVLRRRAPDALRPYKAWGYPAIPILYVAAATVMMLVLLVYKPLYTWPGLLIVVLGAPVYFVWRAFKPRASNCA
jgi:APA family basic amino acid/polyamine antiporter